MIPINHLFDDGDVWIEKKPRRLNVDRVMKTIPMNVPRQWLQPVRSDQLLRRVDRTLQLGLRGIALKLQQQLYPLSRCSHDTLRDSGGRSSNEMRGDRIGILELPTRGCVHSEGDGIDGCEGVDWRWETWNEEVCCGFVYLKKDKIYNDDSPWSRFRRIATVCQRQKSERKIRVQRQEK